MVKKNVSYFFIYLLETVNGPIQETSIGILFQLNIEEKNIFLGDQNFLRVKEGGGQIFLLNYFFAIYTVYKRLLFYSKIRTMSQRLL